MNDLNVSIEWSTLQQRKRELSSGWGEDESSAIRPLDDYRDHNHLCEIVLNQFERDLENIIDRAMASRAQTRPALRNNISGEQQILLEDFRSGDFTRQRKALERLSVLAENHSPKFLAESVTLASEANRLDDQIRMGLIRGNDQALGISNLVQRGVELLNRIAQRPDSVPVRGAATKIVISYRRADSSGTTGRILDRLTGHYGKDSVFIDIDSIPVGADFRQHIREALEDCDIMLAIVGRKWLGPINRRNRINEPNDIVRLEIEMALQNGIAIVPVLVDGATMPKAGQLPDSFQNFTFRNAAIVGTGLDFHNHVDRLIASMDSSLKAKRRGGKTR